MWKLSISYGNINIFIRGKQLTMSCKLRLRNGSASFKSNYNHTLNNNIKCVYIHYIQYKCSHLTMYHSTHTHTHSEEYFLWAEHVPYKHWTFIFLPTNLRSRDWDYPHYRWGEWIRESNAAAKYRRRWTRLWFQKCALIHPAVLHLYF